MEGSSLRRALRKFLQFGEGKSKWFTLTVQRDHTSAYTVGKFPVPDALWHLIPTCPTCADSTTRQTINVFSDRKLDIRCARCDEHFNICTPLHLRFLQALVLLLRGSALENKDPHSVRRFTRIVQDLTDRTAQADAAAEQAAREEALERELARAAHHARIANSAGQIRHRHSANNLHRATVAPGPRLPNTFALAPGASTSYAPRVSHARPAKYAPNPARPPSAAFPVEKHPFDRYPIDRYPASTSFGFDDNVYGPVPARKRIQTCR